MERFVDRRIVMGVECLITTHAPEEAMARAATRDAFLRMEAIEAEISSWRPGSLTSLLHQQSGKAVQVGPDLLCVLHGGLTWARRSDGAFDPTIGVLCDTWRTARSRGALPEPSRIDAARASSGWREVSLDLAARTATIKRDGLRLDFGGIGKGYAADEALRVLREHGLDASIIEIGGDVVAGSPPPQEEGWAVAIGGLADEAAIALDLANGAMATSGDVEQHLEIDGTRYSHIIDPASGMAITTPVQVTAVVRGGRSPGADADALASAASVLVARGEDPARLLAGLPGAELFIVNPRDGTTTHHGPTPQGSVVAGAHLDVLFDEGVFTEGPAATASGAVFFTDQPNDRILLIDTEGEVTVHQEPSGRANGLYVDPHGALWSCADEENQLIRTLPDGRREVVLAEGVQHRFNGPNDLWIAPDGSIYFTDPFYRRRYWQDTLKRNPREDVYRLSPDLTTLSVVASDFQRPNGIVGTPDGRTLYVADIKASRTYAFAIQADGSLSQRRLFCSHGSDGMTLDEQGNLYLTGDGVRVFAPSGELIEWIPIPERWTANICFGGPNHDTLFITASGRVYGIASRWRGAAWPR